MEKDFGNNRIANIETLSQAFAAFSDTTSKFQEAYAKLEERIGTLSHELAEKNKILSKKIVQLDTMQKYLNNILENVTDAVIAVNFKGVITTFNRAAQTMTGFAARDILGKRYDVVFPLQAKGKEFVSGVINNSHIQSGKETVIKSVTGDQIPVVAYTSPITNEHSRVVGVVITCYNLSHIKQLESEIERSKRLAALGEMAAGVAHEIRNPLGGIEMFASLLERELQGDERKASLSRNIIQGVRSLNKIITELLTFTRTFNRTHFDSIDLIDCIESALCFASQEITRKNIRIEKNFSSSDSCVVYGDSDQLRQVLLNMFLNASQAIDEKEGCIAIDCDYDENQEYALLRIIDNGKGISKKDIEKIFDPFFTTKIKGTGLGLAISYRIIEAHGGTIEVKSVLHKGSEFTISVPVARDEK